MIGDNEEVVAVRHSELGCSADGRPAVGEAGVELDEPADPAVLPIGRCGHRMRLFRFLQRTPGVRRARQTAKDSDQCRYGLARLKSCEPQILLTGGQGGMPDICLRAPNLKNENQSQQQERRENPSCDPAGELFPTCLIVHKLAASSLRLKSHAFWRGSLFC